MGYAAPQVVEGQPREGLPYGLFSSLTFRTPTDEHWANGVEWEAPPCDPAQLFEDPDCDSSLTNSYVTSLRGEAPGIAVSGLYKCGTPGGRADIQSQEKATAHLLTQEEKAVEQHVWARLAADPSLVTLSGATSVQEAVAELEQYAGDTFGFKGVIHAPRKAASLHVDLHRSGSKLLTNLDTQVVAGGGYDATSLTLYVTPALFGYRSSVFNQTLVDPNLNDAYAIAQRSYVVAWDPCPIAAITVA